MTYHLSVAFDLVSIPEIAELLGVSQQRVHQLIASYADFPAPHANLAIGRVWLRTRIDDWASNHPRRPGRRPSTNAPSSPDSNRPPSGGAGASGGDQTPRQD